MRGRKQRRPQGVIGLCRALRAAQRARRPKRRKLDSRPVLVSQVEEWLIELWSPEQIARRLRDEFPGDPMMQVSHETIYKSLFVQGRCALRRELTACLRSGRVVLAPDAVSSGAAG